MSTSSCGSCASHGRSVEANDPHRRARAEAPQVREKTREPIAAERAVEKVDSALRDVRRGIAGVEQRRRHHRRQRSRHFDELRLDLEADGACAGQEMHGGGRASDAGAHIDEDVGVANLRAIDDANEAADRAGQVRHAADRKRDVVGNVRDAELRVEPRIAITARNTIQASAKFRRLHQRTWNVTRVSGWISTRSSQRRNPSASTANRWEPALTTIVVGVPSYSTPFASPSTWTCPRCQLSNLTVLSLSPDSRSTVTSMTPRSRTPPQAFR
jgi:hypothetical protein